MICRVCGKETPGNEGRCPDCGFRLMRFAGDGEDDELQRIADNYRYRLLNQYEIRVMTYKYKKTGRNISLDRKMPVRLAICSSLQRGRIVWMDSMTFEHPDKAGPAHVEVEIRRGEESRNLHLTIESPGSGEDPWQLGVRLREYMNIEIVLGDETSNRASEVIRLPDVFQ